MNAETVATADGLPIVVDLDGTLTSSDTLVESFIVACFNTPLKAMRALLTLKDGPHAFKATVADMVAFDPGNVPYRQDFIDWLTKERQRGRDIHLVTAAHQSIADAIGSAFPIFKSVTGSSAEYNLKGQAKADFLLQRFPGGFVYAGDSEADLKVWPHAAAAILTGDGLRYRDRLAMQGIPVAAEFPGDEPGWRHWMSLLRVHQWSKNLMIFVPLVLSHSLGSFDAVARTFAAFILFNLVASATYVVNDLSDLHADRLHATKNKRAIASGAISAQASILIGAIILALGLTGIALLSAPFFLMVMCYLVLTIAYSYRLKKVPILDATIIGMLFTLRVGMGIAVLALPASLWLLSFAFLFFFSLALAKRHGEVMQATDARAQASLARRGYRAEDWPLTLTFGVAATIGGTIIMILYIRFDAQGTGLYRSPLWLFAAPLGVLIWAGRVWLLSHRRELDDDPIVFALKDRVSWMIFGLIVVGGLLAL